jgi:hypothetical protein
MFVQAGCDQRPHLRGRALLSSPTPRKTACLRSLQELPMFTAEQFRAKAAECAESLKNSVVPSEIREFQRSKQSFSLLAQNKDWLAENFDRLIRVQDLLPQDDIVERNVDRKAVAKTKEHILQCLEAALIMKWNTIPTALQQELFDPDGSPGDSPQTSTLRRQIVRFLHDRKDNEN